MNSDSLNKGDIKQEILHSKRDIASYGVSDFILNIFYISFGAYVFYFYEAELGLQSWLAAIGFIIYAIWNAINDPLVGIICDRPFFFTKKWGRRFLWIVSSMFPSILIYVILYAPPNVDPVDGQLILFGWLIFATCLYDTILTFWAVNYGALFADKFRNHNERRTASGIEMMLVYLGIAVGSLIPPFIIHYGVKESFIDQAWALVIIALIASVFALPGLREDKETVNRYLETWKAQKERGEKGSVIKTFIMTLRNKNFVMYILLFLGYNILRACLLGSINYGFRFVLKLPAIYSTIVMAAYLLSSLLTTPIWTIIIKKIDNNRKVMLLGAILSCIFTFPITFLTDLVSWMILITLWGVGIAGLYVANRPAFADIIDENVLKTGKRQEGVYNGVSLFIMRFAVVAQAIIFAVVHELTGFVEGADTQSASAIWGIQLTMGAIPMLFLFFGTLAFWKYYDLTPSKVKEIKAKLTELKL